MGHGGGHGGGNVIDSFFIALGFEPHTEGAAEVEHRMNGIKGAMLGLTAAVTGVAYGIGHMVHEAVASMADVNRFAEINEMAAGEISAWGKVAKENDSSMEAMMATMRSLNSTAGQAATGIGRGAKLFQMLGLKAKDAHGEVKSFDTLMGDVADRMEGKSAAEQLMIARRLGIDENLIPLLREGREEVHKLVAEARAASPFTEADYRKADAIEKTLVKTKMALGSLSKQVAVALFPVVKQATTFFLDWWKSLNKATGPDRRTAMDKFSEAMLRLWRAVVRVAVVVKDVVKWLVETKWVIVAFLTMKLGEWWLGVAKAMQGVLGVGQGLKGMFASLGRGIAVLGLAALIDDLWAFYTGGNSVVGLLQKKFPAAANVASMAAIFLALSLAKVNKKISLIVTGVLGWIKAIKELRDNWNVISQWFESGDQEREQQQMADSAYDPKRNTWQSKIKWNDNPTVKPSVNPTAEWDSRGRVDPFNPTSYQPTAVPPTGPAPVIDNSTTTNTFQINEASNPRETAREVDLRLREHTRNLQRGAAL